VKAIKIFKESMCIVSMGR